MVSFDVRIDASEVLKALNVDMVPVLSDITFAAGELVRSEVAVYPGPAHKPIIWASEKQRRFYFWMRTSQGLPLGYTRNSDAMSQRLGPSWTVDHLGTIDAVVDNKATYGLYVQSHIYQTAQHKATGWITDEQAVNNVQRSGDVERVADKIIAGMTAFKD